MSHDDDGAGIFKPLNDLAQVGGESFDGKRPRNITQLAAAAQVYVDGACVGPEGGDNAAPDRAIGLPAVDE
jgi:hypothetical protein